MTREPWDYDSRSHKVILNVGRESFRRGRQERSISTILLNRPRLVVLIVIITILFILFLKEARSVLASNPQFMVQDIVLENTDLINKDVVYDILKLDSPRCLFNISTNKIVRLLKKDPDIESAIVERILPGTIKIIIKERSAYAILNIGGKKYYIDRNGILLFREREDATIPTIYGLKIDPARGEASNGVYKLVPGELCNVPELDNILNILRTGEGIGWNKFIEPVEVRVSSGDSISINTRERILVKLKMTDTEEQLNKLMFVLNDAQRRGKLIETVDLRFKDVYVE